MKSICSTLPPKRQSGFRPRGYENWDEEDDDESVPWLAEDIVKYILYAFVLSTAEDWHNDRIERYLDR